MWKLILLTLIAIPINFIHCQYYSWQTYALDSIIQIDFPGIVYEIDTMLQGVKIYQLYTNAGSTVYCINKIRAEDEDINENFSTLPHDSMSLEEFYQGAIKGVVKKAPGKLENSNIFYRHGYKGYRLEFTDSLNNTIFLTEQYLLNRYLYGITIMDSEGIDTAETKRFFNSLWINKDDSITQLYGKSRGYRIGYLLGQNIFFIVIVGVVIALIVRRVYK